MQNSYTETAQIFGYSLFLWNSLSVLKHLWVSRHEAVHVVVDLLEHKTSVHQVEAALQNQTKIIMKLFQHKENTADKKNICS